MKRFVAAVIVALSLACTAAIPGAAADELILGSGDSSMSMNSSGQFVIGVFDAEKRGPLRFYSGHVDSPFPAATELGDALPEPESLNSAVLENGTRILAWDVLYSRYRFQGKSAMFGDDTATVLRGSVRPLPDFISMQFPGLVVGPNDEAVRFWAWTGRRRSTLYVSSKSATGEFGDPRAFKTVASPQSLSGVNAGLDKRGTPTFSWWHDDRTLKTITGNARGGRVREESVRGFDGCESSQLAVAPSGAALLSMACGGAVKYSMRSARGRFSRVRSLTQPRSNGHLDPVILNLPRNRMLIAWTQVGKKQDRRVLASIGTAGRRFSKPRALTAFLPPITTGPGVSPGLPVNSWGVQLLLGTAGRPYIASRLANDQALRVAPVSSDLKLGTSTMVLDQYEHAEVAISTSGRALAIWDRSSSNAGTYEKVLTRFTVPAP